MAKQNEKINTAKVTADKARIDRLKEQLREVHLQSSISSGSGS